MALVTVARPTELPISLAEAKSQCRVTDSNHDDRLIWLIQRATASIETLMGARLASQTVRLDMDTFPRGAIDLSVFPVQSVTSIKYDDADNVETTLVDNTDYWLDLGGLHPRAVPVTTWPETKDGKPAAVRITMVVGYSDSNDMPADVKHAILVRLKEWFDNSAESVVGNDVYPTVTSINHLIAQHSRHPV